jgi:hypothetical protein
MPGEQRASAEEAMLFLDSLSERLTYITPEAAEYRSVIANAAESGITGGQIYDALLAQCAIKAKTEIIYTWNVAHYQRLGSNVANLVRAP